MSTILLVDDSELILNVLGEALGSKGYTVITAKDGVEGILRVYRDIPDLIISDVEMPRLQGYQMSRLLKNRREVRKIPIIMHTSLSEDRDKFWADSSGADAFITKDFDKLDLLGNTIDSLLEEGQKPDKKIIAEDALNMNEYSALEMLGTLFDRELFQSTILNKLSSIESHIGSLALTSSELMKHLGNVCRNHIIVLAFHYDTDARMFILSDPLVSREERDAFIPLCVRDFEKKTGSVKGSLYKSYLGQDPTGHGSGNGRSRISSYHSVSLSGKDDKPVGTLHLGNMTNNYYSDLITDNIAVFARGAATILENAILFNTIDGMKKKINTLFKKFVPEEVINELMNKRDTTEMKIGEKREVAILFSDIRSFTVISENNSAERIVGFLNRYFQTMVSLIKNEGGTIDKFIGDAILAVFGAPVSYEDNSARAVRAALAMEEALKNFDTQGLILPEGGLRQGIGIHEGNVIVGNIGSSDKINYTVVGDNVNLASRLENLTKYYHVGILVSDQVYKSIELEFSVRVVDTVCVKGKEQATTLYTVEHRGHQSLDSGGLELYKKGLSMYKLRNWMTAKEYFDTILKTYPDDYLCSLYSKRCQEFSTYPPPPDWGGAIRLDFK